MNKRNIVINWKWIGEAPIASGAPIVPGNWRTPDGKEVLWCLNQPREEAVFDDEYEACCDLPNSLLAQWLETLSGQKTVLLLHKNAPHYYSSYDLAWFQEKLPQVHVALFGGGEDFIYSLQHPLGLLDQVGQLDMRAMEAGCLRLSHFDAVWEHYTTGGSAWLLQFSYALFPYLLAGAPHTVPANLKAKSAALLQALGVHPPNTPAERILWPMPTPLSAPMCIKALTEIAQGQPCTQGTALRNAIESALSS